ncbi:hypothetical protein DFR70_110244 [Nocardia tenerifensis]|uniref:Schlafen AlbA-2 domain-containing protein n=1 Tax=Nocardia tenerifensis TaxID=228006 RepID=A0A318JZK2_9NOCA|nr:ATP-binding protein [Nocardia tenerifensis]PXX60402.1 hypothetical protein DFR70_110244 [Nocardia tenerifensis]
MSAAGPFWNPRTEDELRRAVADGLLEETHTLDIKRELERGKSANKKLGCDIAAFSLDGGIIVIGVDEDTDPPCMWPVELDGLAERIENIAATLVREPVHVRTTAIPAHGQPGKGYLLVHIAPSPRAPHMVDGRYYGRGDKTNIVLDYADVLRLHEHQLAKQKDILPEIHQAITNLGERKRLNSILGILAEPLGAPRDLLLPVTEDRNWSTTIGDLVRSTSVQHNRDYSPNFYDASSFERTANGVAVKTMYEGQGWNGDGRTALLEFHETGRLFMASEGAVFPADQRHDSNMVFETLILGHTDLLVRLAAAISQTYGLAGTWRFGLVLTGLRTARSYTLALSIGGRGPAYTESVYEQATDAALLDLANDHTETVKALVGRLLRGLGSHHRCESFLAAQ